jgi:hypothetical protein
VGGYAGGCSRIRVVRFFSWPSPPVRGVELVPAWVPAWVPESAAGVRCRIGFRSLSKLVLEAAPESGAGVRCRCRPKFETNQVHQLSGSLEGVISEFRIATKLP